MATFFLALVSLLIVGVLIGTLVFLLDGWVNWTFGAVLLAIAIVALWFVFAWVLIIALAVIASAVAGLFMGGGES